MTTVEQIASWASSLAYEDLPEGVLHKARWQMASVLAASFAGRHDAGACRVLRMVRRDGGQGPTRVLAGGFRSSRPAAVLANASLSCTFDFDEILLLGHPGHSSVTVPLAVGEELDQTWGDAVAAQVAANEVAGRLGFSTVLGPQNGQMLPYLHCASAAIATGRLLRLDEKRMAHALAVSLAQPPAALWPAFLGQLDSKVLIAAQGAQMGVTAAQLAADGFTGPLDILDHSHGFFRRFAFAPLRRALGGLGRAWLTDTLQVKLHAACWYHQALLDGVQDSARALVARLGRNVLPSDIRRVRCRVSFLAEAVDALERLRPHEGLTANEVNFSIPAGVAVMLLRGQVQPMDLTSTSLHAMDAAVRELASKVEVSHHLPASARILSALDDAVDLGGLLGDATGTQLLSAWRSLREEFPHTPGVAFFDLLPVLPGLLSRATTSLRAGRKAYDLGQQRVSSLTLPIPASFDIELADGTVLSGARDTPEGALSLAAAPDRVAKKLRDSVAPTLTGDGADRLVRLVQSATRATRVKELLAPLDGAAPVPG